MNYPTLFNTKRYDTCCAMWKKFLQDIPNVYENLAWYLIADINSAAMICFTVPVALTGGLGVNSSQPSLKSGWPKSVIKDPCCKSATLLNSGIAMSYFGVETDSWSPSRHYLGPMQLQLYLLCTHIQKCWRIHFKYFACVQWHGWMLAGPLQRHRACTRSPT